MMYDLRNYKQLIKEAVKRESDADYNWNWKVLAVNKMEVRIGWGYLDYLGEKNPFKIRLDVYRWEDSKRSDVFLTGYYPNVEELNPLEMDDAVVVSIGNEFYHDAHSLENGLKMAIHSLASMAHNTF